MTKLGLSWCRDCKWWVAIADVRAGLCRAHRNADYRRRYAEDGRAIRARVYARKRSIDPLPVEAAELLLETTDGLCGYSCGRAATTFDHVIPVSKGGRTEPGNIVPACGPCNSSKGNRDPLTWIGRMTDEALDLILPTLTDDGPVLELLVS